MRRTTMNKISVWIATLLLLAAVEWKGKRQETVASNVQAAN
jgi:hypothetical protein